MGGGRRRGEGMPLLRKSVVYPTPVKSATSRYSRRAGKGGRRLCQHHTGRVGSGICMSSEGGSYPWAVWNVSQGRGFRIATDGRVPRVSVVRRHSSAWDIPTVGRVTPWPGVVHARHHQVPGPLRRIDLFDSILA